MMNMEEAIITTQAKEGISEKKKSIILFSTLGGILLALIFVYAFLVAPLLYDTGGNGTNPPEIFDGEATNGITVSLYPGIKDENLLEIKVKHENDEYAFVQATDKDGKKKMVIKGHTEVTYDTLVYTYLLILAREPRVPIGGSVMRGLTSEQMEQYGVTKELCKARIDIKYLDAGKEKTRTLYIGSKAISSSAYYYCAIEGRSTVYTLNASSIDKAVLLNLTDYISPYVYKKFSSASEAGVSMDSFGIFLTTREGGKAKDVLLLEQNRDEATDTSASFFFTFPEVYPQKIIASNDYVLEVLNKLYVNFTGDKTVAINPDEPTCEKYGLGIKQEQYMVYGKVKNQTDDNALPVFYISKEMDGYHYVMSYFYAEPVIVKMSANQLAFLRTDTETRLAWAATNSVFAGFSQYLQPDMETGAPGVKTMKIRTRDYNEEFTISINANFDLVVTSTNGKYVFKDSDSPEPYQKNQFANLYTLLLYFPMPSRFTEVEKNEMENIKRDENIIYQLEVQLNDKKAYKYTYYTLDSGYSGYALCESCEGYVNENGEYIYTETQTVFDVKSRQIGVIAEAYKIIMEGGKINPLDYIY